MLIATILFVLGLSAGSFVNALVWRLHEQGAGKKSKPKSQNLSVISGRSMCVNCLHTLAWYDLIPLLSWLFLKGRCRHCQKPISVQYPVVELLGGLIFAGSYILWPYTLHLNGQWLLLATWLTSAVGLLALAVYDLRWMLLPNKIIYPTLTAAVAGRTAYIVAFEPRVVHGLVLWLFSLIIASGVFFALFMVSKGKWIGYGDVRLGLIIGTLLADPQKSLAALFIASFMGSLVAVPSLLMGKKTLASKLPYGPFLIMATGLMVICGDSLLNWYKNLFGL